MTLNLNVALRTGDIKGGLYFVDNELKLYYIDQVLFLLVPNFFMHCLNVHLQFILP